tara:strand:+ start:47 stop:1087 length:1041 start_codon:yes stop_codon:yes gene_type:complete
MPTLDFVQNALCAALHLGSATLIVALKPGPWADYNRQIGSGPWEHTCCVNSTYNATVLDCATTAKYFYSVGTGGTIPVLALTVLFAAWSGLGHLVNCAYLHRQEQQMVWTASAYDAYHSFRLIVRGLDYALSSAIMLLVINVLFGAVSNNGVILAPMLQGLVIFFGAAAQYHLDFNTGTVFWKYVSPAIAVALYGWAWTYTFKALADADEAPKFLIFVLIIIFAVFSSFAVVYFWQWYVGGKIDYREFLMNTLSAIAKLLLHAFVAISLFQQANMLHTSPPPLGMQCAPNEVQSDAEDLATAGKATAGIVCGVVVLNALAYWKYTPVTRPNTVGNTQKLLVATDSI